MTKKRHVLLVEDTAPLSRVYIEYLKPEPYEVALAETGKEAFAKLEEEAFEAIVLDLRLPDMNGIEILKYVRKRNLPAPVVVITAHGSINTAVEAMREGAYDFIVKPFNADRLIVTLRNALERQELSEIVDAYRKDIDRHGFAGFIGASLAMQRVYRIIESAAPSNATVFITGESGTGKELCAEAIHNGSPRRDKPFVAINCAAIPKGLVESEIFGHVKGAFTGAVAERDGAASLADGGTLFLDEVCDMPFDLQATLLRFIQTGTFSKVGGSRTEKVDVRFVCATNRDPQAEVERGRFREDLFYRLRVIPIQISPLREREDDILLLARHFLEEFAETEGRKFTEFTPEAEAALLSHAWPGNVRELQNTIRNAVVLNDGEAVTPEMLPLELGAGAAPPPGEMTPSASSQAIPAAKPQGAAVRPIWQVEKEMIEAALRQTDDNVPRAAALLEISPSTIYRKMQAWEARKKE